MKSGQPNWIIFLLAGLILNSPSVSALEFFYKFKTGDKYRIVSTVNMDIYVDRRLSYRSEILNRIAVEITGLTQAPVEGSRGISGSGEKARHTAVFQSAEKTVAIGTRTTRTAPFQWSRDYESVFEQDRLGYMTVGDEYYVPMVRNVPVFPDRNLNPGDTWSAEGMEVHDFRDSYGIEKPYRIPFTANYAYLGERAWKGVSYPAFSVSYRISTEGVAAPGKVYPRRIQVASDQVVYWDAAQGQAVAYEEHFRTVLDLSDGQTWEYRGRAEAEVVEAPPMDKENIAQDIAEEIAAIPDASVRISDEGIVISLENIQFAPDSAILRPSERPKLDKVAEILMRYPDRDILVGGHTALAGTSEGRLRLSRERAASVAQYLIDKGVRTPDRVVIRGYGAERPVADNRTAEGMARNRRVEIIILEN